MRAFVTVLSLVGLAGCTPEPSLSKDGGVDGAHDLAAAEDAFFSPDLLGQSFPWKLPSGFPVPDVPADNPMSVAKVELGRHLFYDKRLSENRTQSCASCHEQARAFTDGRTTSVGSTGALHPRNSMTLANVAYTVKMTWANPLLDSFETQAPVPIFGTEPVELGMSGKEGELLARLGAEPRYQTQFSAAFPGEPTPITIANLVRALGAFQRTLLSGDSPYDRFVHGDTTAISESAKRGAALFSSEKMECFHCHECFNFQDSVRYQGKAFIESRFHNRGLYNIDGLGAYPAPNRGTFELTDKPSDMGRFRVPTLRNIAVTAPYMHDGSIATLSEVLDHYAVGGRTIASGPFAGNGSASPLKSTLLIGFTLTAEERADVLAFFDSLTDTGFLTNSAFGDPW